MLFHLPRYCARSLVVVLPYFPTGTMERVDEGMHTFARVHVAKRMRGCSRVVRRYVGLVEGQIATAMSLARLLSSIPPLGEGPAKVLIYDIHALGERYGWPYITLYRLGRVQCTYRCLLQLTVMP